VAGIGIGYSSLASAVEIGLLLHPPTEALEALLPSSPPSTSLTLEGRSNEMNLAALSVLAASIVAKELLFRKTLECGQAANSAVRIVPPPVCLFLGVL
jgi:divalent metal cation (Fe/Co/Zn/Cd) transporter